MSKGSKSSVLTFLVLTCLLLTLVRSQIDCKGGKVYNPTTNSCVVQCPDNTPFVSKSGKACVVACVFPNEVAVNGTCTCKNGTFTNVDGNGCVSECPGSQIADVTRKCIADQNFACNTPNETLVNKTCVCATNYYLNYNRTACVSNCSLLTPSGLANLNRTLCVENCPARNQINDTIGCICTPSTIRSLNGTDCIPACETGQFRNVQGNQCISRCGNNEQSVDNACVCRPGFVRSTANSSCVASCASNEVINLNGTMCALAPCPTNQVPLNGRCLCNASSLNLINYQGDNCTRGCPAGQSSNNLGGSAERCICNFTIGGRLTLEGDNCTDNCPPGQFLNLNKTRCIQSCSDDGQVSKSGNCTCGVSRVLSLDGNQCINKCPSNQRLNLNGTQCVLGCGIGEDDSAGDGQCRCSIGRVINSTGNGCRIGCDISEFLNLQGTRCFAQCPNTTVPSTTTPGRCVCPNGQFINLDNATCTQTGDCGNNGSISVSRDRCVADCSSVNQVLNSTSNNSCQCAPRTFLNLQGNGCVRNCALLGAVLNIQGTQCVLGCINFGEQNTNNEGRCRCVSGLVLANNITCVALLNCSRIGAIDETNNTCVNITAGQSCPRGANVIIDPVNGLNYCRCAGALNLNQTACVTTCPIGVRDITGRQCVLFCDRDNEIGVDGSCVCAPGTYLNENGTSCVTVCPNRLNLNKTQCVRQCIAVGADDSKTRGICECSSGLIPNAQGTACTGCNATSNQFLSFDGTICLTVCPVNSIGNSTRNVRGQSQCICNSTSVINLAGKACQPAPCSEGFLNQTNNRCVKVCPNKLNILGDKCVPNCNFGRQDDFNMDCQCECTIGDYISSNGTICVDTCSETSQIINVNGTRCVSNCSDPATQAFQTRDMAPINQMCICDPLQNAFLAPNGTSCIQGCGFGLILDVRMRQCVRICQLNASPSPTNASQCVCNPGYFKNRAGDTCVSSCASGEVLNLKGDQCVVNCLGVAQVRGTMQCQCFTGYFRALNGSACVNNCTPDGTINLIRSQCVANCSVNEINIVSISQCICAANAYLNLATNSCVQVCPRFVDIQGRQCVVQCGTNQEPFMGQCRCITGSFVNISGSGCTTSCSSGQVLNLQKNMCILTCPNNALNVSGQCTCRPGSALSPNNASCVLCSQNGQVLDITGNNCVNNCRNPNQTLNAASTQCVCNSFAGYLLSSDGSQCLNQCPSGQFVIGNQCTVGCPGTTLVIDFLGQNCVSSCRASEVIDPVRKRCVCASNAFLNANATGCVSICPLLNFAGTQCVSMCRANEQNIGGRCICADGNVLNLTRDGCQSLPCPAGQALSLNESQCVNNTCGSNEVNVNGKCQCRSNTYINFNNLGQRQCVTFCPRFINLIRTTCVPICSVNQLQPTTPGNGLCQCASGKPLNLAQNQCLDQCGPNQISFSNQCRCSSNAVVSSDGLTCVAIMMTAGSSLLQTVNGCDSLCAQCTNGKCVMCKNNRVPDLSGPFAGICY